MVFETIPLLMGAAKMAVSVSMESKALESVTLMGELLAIRHREVSTLIKHACMSFYVIFVSPTPAHFLILSGGNTILPSPTNCTYIFHLLSV
jgi:hypothetical protein